MVCLSRNHTVEWRPWWRFVSCLLVLVCFCFAPVVWQFSGVWEVRRGIFLRAMGLYPALRNLHFLFLPCPLRIGHETQVQDIKRHCLGDLSPFHRVEYQRAFGILYPSERHTRYTHLCIADHECRTFSKLFLVSPVRGHFYTFAPLFAMHPKSPLTLRLLDSLPTDVLLSSDQPWPVCPATSPFSAFAVTRQPSASAVF